MDITQIISFFGGLAFFLFGMSMMGESLKKVAGNKMQMILGKLASNRFKGIALGTFVTAIIQSSSATSVMAVSFVSSGIMTLTQAICVVMGANIGTTATGWILTLAGLDNSSALGSLLSTTFIFGVVAVIGIIIYMMGKSTASKSTGSILVSLSILMSGMTAMSDAMKPLQYNETFMNLMSVANPVLCVIVGILITAVIQSCSASIGILQAMSMTGMIPHSVAVPMVVGMSIGACVPVLISGLTANKDGKRTALSYLYFNIIGGLIFLIAYTGFGFTATGIGFNSQSATSMSIAIINTLFKVFAVVIIFPFVPQLEKLVRASIKDSKETGSVMLEEMLLDYPAQALERAGTVIARMAEIAQENMDIAMGLLYHFDQKKYDHLIENENEQDDLEDKLSGFLVKLNGKELKFHETRQSAEYLHCITDLERISDHSENVAKIAQEMHDTQIKLSTRAEAELSVCIEATQEIMSMTIDSLIHNNVAAARPVEPLEQVIDAITERLKQNHIDRLQNGECSLQAGFFFNDSLNNFERVADHCSNIAVSVIEREDWQASKSHSYLRTLKTGDSELFLKCFGEFSSKYTKMLQKAGTDVANIEMKAVGV